MLEIKAMSMETLNSRLHDRSITCSIGPNAQNKISRFEKRALIAHADIEGPGQPAH